MYWIGLIAVLGGLSMILGPWVLLVVIGLILMAEL